MQCKYFYVVSPRDKISLPTADQDMDLARVKAALFSKGEHFAI